MKGRGDTESEFSNMRFSFSEIVQFAFQCTGFLCSFHGSLRERHIHLDSVRRPLGYVSYPGAPSCGGSTFPYPSPCIKSTSVVLDTSRSWRCLKYKQQLIYTYSKHLWVGEIYTRISTVQAGPATLNGRFRVQCYSSHSHGRYDLQPHRKFYARLV